MRLHSTSAPRFSAPILFGIALVSLLLVGCRQWVRGGGDPETLDPGPPSDEPPPAAVEPAATKPAPPTLSDGTWMLRVPQPGQTPSKEEPRWRHVALEDLLSQAAEDRPEFAAWLNDGNPVVAANAAIALARLKEGAPAERLAATVRTPTLKLVMRRAAAEALGACQADDARPALDKLLAVYGDHHGTARGKYIAELHQELIAARLRIGAEIDEAQLTAALESPAAAVRLATLEAWPPGVKNIPPTVIDLASDSDWRVRSAAIELAAKCRHSQALELGQRALADHQLEVRLAAIGALGAIGGDEARTALKKMLVGEPEKVRAAVVSAFAEMHDTAEVIALAGDTSWYVRQAVARGLRHDPNASSVAAIERLLDDASIPVGQAAIEALRDWPLPVAAPVLMTALERPSYAIRKSAAEQLADRWAAGPHFPVDAPPPRRGEALATMRRQWNKEFPSATVESAVTTPTTSPTAEPLDSATKRRIAELVAMLASADRTPQELAESEQELIAVGPRLTTVLAELAHAQKSLLPPAIYESVLPKIDARFERIERLAHDDLAERRLAATALAGELAQRPLEELALERIADLIASESDSAVWRTVQIALADDRRASAFDLEVAALTHPAADVRMRACQHLSHSAKQYAVQLTAALDDSSPSVQLAAVRALSGAERLDNQLPLVRLLASRDKALVLAAATTLTKFSSDSGIDALERLAHDDDPNIRRGAAEAMGATALPQFTGTLVRLLDDQLGVKRVALKSLAQVTGEDIGLGKDEKTPDMAEQIARWKKWAAEQHVRGRTAPRRTR